MNPITDLFDYLQASGLPRTAENIQSIAKMLSLTEAELALALTLAEQP